MEQGKEFEKEIVEELEQEVENVEKDFEEVKEDDAPETVREKQERVENILKEVHGQISTLKEVAETVGGNKVAENNPNE